MDVTNRAAEAKAAFDEHAGAPAGNPVRKAALNRQKIAAAAMETTATDHEQMLQNQYTAIVNDAHIHDPKLHRRQQRWQRKEDHYAARHAKALNDSTARRLVRMHKNVRTRGHRAGTETGPPGFRGHGNRPSGWTTEPDSPNHQRPLREELSGGDTDTWSGTDKDSDHEDVKLWKRQTNTWCQEDEKAWQRLPKSMMTPLQLRQLDNKDITADEIVFGSGEQQRQLGVPKMTPAYVLPRTGSLPKGIEAQIPTPARDMRCNIKYLNALQCVEFAAIYRAVEKSVKGQAAQHLLSHRTQNLIEALSILDLHYGKHSPADTHQNFLRLT